MQPVPRIRIWAETVLCVAAALLAATTVAVPDWIETVFGVDPDHGNGTVEWAIALGLAVLAVVCGGLARRDRKRVAANSIGF
jgi:hypothetical protein